MGNDRRRETVKRVANVLKRDAEPPGDLSLGFAAQSGCDDLLAVNFCEWHGDPP